LGRLFVTVDRRGVRQAGFRGEKPEQPAAAGRLDP
jgi:hypothetical protein